MSVKIIGVVVVWQNNLSGQNRQNYRDRMIERRKEENDVRTQGKNSAPGLMRYDVVIALSNRLADLC